VWWLAVAALLGGVAWLIGRGWSVGPAVTIAAALVVVVLLPALSRPYARRRARRYAGRVVRRLRDGASTVAREAVAPVRGVLRDYGAARSALQAAAGRAGGAGGAARTG
jgi:hypothetical protein